jgi:hydrogenase-4 membrane subunit HyfE
MSPLLMGILGVMLVPLFVATWRTSLLGLSCQGLLIAWAAYRLDPNLRTLGTWLTLLDLAVVRGAIAPLLLLRAMIARKRPAQNAMVPPNLVSWTVAFGLVIAAFSLSTTLVPTDGDQRAIISVATAGVLLSFLVLASQPAPFGQVAGALRLENAIALFELGGEHRHHDALVIQVGQLAIVAGTIGLYVWLLRGLPESGSVRAPPIQDEPTL